MEAFDLYTQVGENLGLEPGQLFGKPCFKFNGKALLCFFENEMVFKLNGKSHAGALQLEDAQLFDPSKKKRPMKEWVQVPYIHKNTWPELAQKALRYATEK